MIKIKITLSSVENRVIIFIMLGFIKSIYCLGVISTCV